MKKTTLKRSVFLLTVLAMALGMFAGCNGTEGAAVTTPAQTTAGTTTAGSTTAASTTPLVTTTEATTTEKTYDFGGYNFVFANRNSANPSTFMIPDRSLSATQALMADVMDELAAEINCTFSLVNYPGRARIYTDTVAGINPGDVIFVGDPEYVIPYGIRGCFIPWNTPELLAVGVDCTDQTAFYPPQVAACTYNGVVYGVADRSRFEYNPVGGLTYFNKELVESRTGVTADVIYQRVRDGQWTWEYFMSLLPQCTFDSDGDNQIDHWGLVGLTPWENYSIPFTNGIQIVEEVDGVMTFMGNDPRVVKGLNFMVNLLNSGTMHTEGPSTQAGWTAFAEGKVAFQFGYLYMTNLGSQYQIDNLDFGWGIVPLPKGPDADGYTFCQHRGGFVMSINNKNYLTSAQILMLRNIALGGADDTTWEEAYRRENRFSDEESYEMISTYLSPYSRLTTFYYTTSLESACINLLNDITKREKTVAQALETHAPRIQAAIDEMINPED